jgi:hypothetical protein
MRRRNVEVTQALTMDWRRVVPGGSQLLGKYRVDQQLLTHLLIYLATVR